MELRGTFVGRYGYSSWSYPKTFDVWKSKSFFSRCFVLIFVNISV